MKTARENIASQMIGIRQCDDILRMHQWNGETPLLWFVWTGGSFLFQLAAPIGTGGALAHRDRRIGWVGHDMARGNGGKCYVVTLTEGVMEVPLQDLLPTIREYHTDKTPLASQGC